MIEEERKQEKEKRRKGREEIDFIARGEDGMITQMDSMDEDHDGSDP